MMLLGSKRPRDHDDDDEVRGQYTESKKLRTLPFRSSPTSQHSALSFSSRIRSITRPNVLTPVESSEDESDDDVFGPKDGNTRQQSQSLYLTDADDDVDMDISGNFDQPVWSPKPSESAFSSTLPPTPRSNLTISTPSTRSIHAQTPRISTPIYGHFSTLSYPADMPPPSPRMPPPYVNTLVYPRIRGDSDSFLKRRALPSPISEDENMDSPTVLTKAMLGNLKMTASPMEESFSSQETLTPDTPSTKSWVSVDALPRNRRRSDAISGDTGKVVFSMGFRADCEKCRERVPGHYSHVIRA